MPFIPNIVDHIVNSLDKYKSEEVLTKIYQWPINNAIKKLAEFDAESASNVNGKNSFEKTLSIRKIVQEKLLEKGISEEENSKYIFWIIKDWGGITRIKDNILQSIRKKEETASFDCTSIASWSKYFAFKYPEKYAIYDASSPSSLL